MNGAPTTFPATTCAITNCMTEGDYANGFKCKACNPGYSLDAAGGCWMSQ